MEIPVLVREFILFDIYLSAEIHGDELSSKEPEGFSY